MIPGSVLRSSKLINVLVGPDNPDFKKSCRMQSFCLLLLIAQELQTIIKGNAGVKKTLLVLLQVFWKLSKGLRASIFRAPLDGLFKYKMQHSSSFLKNAYS